MKQLASDKIAIIGGLLYSLILGLSVYFEFMLFALVPLALILFWWAIKRMDLFMGVLLLAVPLSINLQEFIYNVPGLYMPTEPMLLGLLVLFILRSCKEYPVDKKLFTHPISRVIGGMMLWIFITSITSYDIVVSLKFFISSVVYS